MYAYVSNRRLMQAVCQGLAMLKVSPRNRVQNLWSMTRLSVGYVSRWFLPKSYSTGKVARNCLSRHWILLSLLFTISISQWVLHHVSILFFLIRRWTQTYRVHFRSVCWICLCLLLLQQEEKTRFPFLHSLHRLIRAYRESAFESREFISLPLLLLHVT